MGGEERQEGGTDGERTLKELKKKKKKFSSLSVFGDLRLFAGRWASWRNWR